MSRKSEIENLSQEIDKHKEKILTMQTQLTQMQDNFTAVMQQSHEIVESTKKLAKKLEIPCNETIALGESLKQIHDKIKGKLQIQETKWESMENDFEESNACFRKYLDCYQTTVLNLADQTSLELDPEESFTSASPKPSLESSSSHFQQMLVAHDPLMDRDLFRNLNTKDLSVNADIQTMKDQMRKFKEINSTIAADVERISSVMQNLCGDDCADKI